MAEGDGLPVVNSTADSAISTLCVLGSIGSGKGSTLNTLFKNRTNDLYHSRLLSSESCEPVSHVSQWQSRGELVRGVDLPACADSFGREVVHIQKMVEYLEQEVKYVNCFLILFHGQEPILGQHLKGMLVAMRDTFGPSFFQHILLGFTRWDYGRRADQTAYSREETACAVNDALHLLLGHRHDFRAVFLDNTLNMFSEEELTLTHGKELPALRLAFENEMQEIHYFVMSDPPFHCQDIGRIEAEKDRDILNRQHARAMVALGSQAFSHLKQTWDDHRLHIHDPKVLLNILETDMEREIAILRGKLADEARPGLESLQASVLEDFKLQVVPTVKVLCEHNDQRSTERLMDLTKVMVSLSKEALTRLEGKWEEGHQSVEDPIELVTQLEEDKRNEIDALSEKLKSEMTPGFESVQSSVLEEFGSEISATMKRVIDRNDVWAVETVRKQKIRILDALSRKSHDRLAQRWAHNHQGIEDHTKLLEHMAADKTKEVDTLRLALEVEAKPDLESMIPALMADFEKYIAFAMRDVIERNDLRAMKKAGVADGRKGRGSPSSKSQPAVKKPPVNTRETRKQAEASPSAVNTRETRKPAVPSFTPEARKPAVPSATTTRETRRQADASPTAAVSPPSAKNTPTNAVRAEARRATAKLVAPPQTENRRALAFLMAPHMA